MIEKDLENDLENLNLEEEKEEPTLILQKPKKPKKTITDKQKEKGAENLKMGREALAKKHEQLKADHLILTNQKILEKAEKLNKLKTKKEQKLNKLLDIDDTVTEIEEHIKIKPKKKKIIYREESDSEEEEQVIIKTKKPLQKVEKIEPKIEPLKKPLFKINFV